MTGLISSHQWLSKFGVHLIKTEDQAWPGAQCAEHNQITPCPSVAVRAEMASEGLRQTGQRGMEQNPLCSAFPSHISFPGPPAPLPQAQG